MFFLLSNRLLLVFPGRVALGKFGMWMVRVGEVLQRRYAGWNKLFKLKVELYPAQNTATFHVSEKITGEAILSFQSPSSQLDKQPPFVQRLFNIRGVTRVYLKPHEIDVHWGKVFSSREIMQKVESALIEAFTK